MAGIASGSSSSSEDLTQTLPGNVDSVDVLLQRRKCELMYELKKIQHGERPVTGSDSRGKVGSFFSKRVQVHENPSPVANVDDVEEHRPQEITIEVQGLIQSRSVSSLLQSERFRRSLEKAVRSNLVAPTTSRRAPARRERAVDRTDLPAAPATPLQSSIPQPPAGAPPRFDDEELPSNHFISSPLLPEPTNPEPHNTQQSSQHAEDMMRSWNHDNFVMEISELVHRQLVSSTLHGEFRDSLERHVGRRVAESGHNGRAVQAQIRGLPPSRIRHNDFTHLGIPSVQDQQQQLDDTVSVISATASATIPFAQSNAAVQREMSGMKAQIAQLSNMLKMSLDLQMDIQRSIRQEVAAAIGQASANTPAGGPAAVAPQYHSHRADDSTCIICLEKGADAVLYKCGHICMCYTCALTLRSANGNCPVCRAPISDIVRAYRISTEQ